MWHAVHARSRAQVEGTRAKWRARIEHNVLVISLVMRHHDDALQVGNHDMTYSHAIGWKSDDDHTRDHHECGIVSFCPTALPIIGAVAQERRASIATQGECQLPITTAE